MNRSRACVFRCLAFVVLVVLIAMGIPRPAQAQSSDGRWEAGVFAGAIDFRESLGEKPVALGVRIAYRLSEYIAIEAEAANCPRNGVGNFGQRLFVAGPRVGMEFGGLGLAAKVRGGFVHFGGNAFRSQNPDIGTKPALNVGAVIELRLSPAVAMRIDTGVTMVPFGSAVIRTPLPPHATEHGTTYNRDGSIGFAFRF